MFFTGVRISNSEVICVYLKTEKISKYIKVSKPGFSLLVKGIKTKERGEKLE